MEVKKNCAHNGGAHYAVSITYHTPVQAEFSKISAVLCGLLGIEHMRVAEDSRAAF